jgi:signal transduction histidine kinase/CheY-like chemotaxis protein
MKPSNRPLSGRAGSWSVSISLRIVLLVLCVAVSALSAAAWAVAATYARESEAARQRLRETARALALTVDRAIGQREAVAWTLATSPSLLSRDWAAFDAQARRAMATLGGWVVLFGPDGMIVNTARPPGAALPRTGEARGYVRTTPSGATISDLFLGPATGQWLVSINVPVEQPGLDGHGLSVVVLPTHLQRVIDEQKLPSGWMASIIDGRGRVVARHPDPSRWIGAPAPAALISRVGREPEGFSAQHSLEGTPIVAFYSTSPAYKWAFVIGVPEAMLGTGARRAAVTVAAVSLLVLAASGLAAAFVGRQIAVPARRLKQAAEALKTGGTVRFEPGGVTEIDVAGNTLADAGTRILAQLWRMRLLDEITRAIGARLDLDSVFQVVANSIEQQLDAFCTVGLHDPHTACLTVAAVGAGSRERAGRVGILEPGALAPDDQALARCLRGELIHEPDLSGIPSAFAQRMAEAGLRSLVLAPLQIEGRLFGLVIVAREAVHAFSSGDCEFLRQLSEQVALAAHQAQLHGELQRAYDNLHRTQQAALQYERMRVLGQMASGIAHDINNAISPALIYVESLLERETQLSPRARQQLETIARAIDDVAATVARLRDFYRPRPLQPAVAPLQLNELVQQVVELTRARWSDMQLQRGIVIELKLDLADDMPSGLGMENEIREALINLIFNAVDAMPEGGVLTVRTGTATVGEAAEALLEVSDTGVGMDEETQRRCLEPFFTTKGERGTGLGLAMVCGSVARHGARLDIESVLGRGTTVRIRLPAAPAAGEIKKQPEEIALPPDLRILVVDDDPVMLHILEATLEADGHRVVTASSGQSGVDEFAAAQERGQPFSLVFTDLGMPRFDGRKVAAAVKRMSAATPVILLTGWGQGIAAEDAAVPHVDEILSKPPKLRELRSALARQAKSAPS